MNKSYRNINYRFMSDSDDGPNSYFDSSDSEPTMWRVTSHKAPQFVNRKRCLYCGQWGVVMSQCQHCGARIDE